MRNRFFLIIIVVIIFGSILLSGTNLYLDLLWFQDLEASQVFWTQHLTMLGMRFGALLFLFAFIFVNLMFTRRYILSFPNLALRERLMAAGFMRFLTPRRLTFFFIGVSAVLAYLLSGYAGSFWMETLRFFNHVPFGINDPAFGADVSFYVFQLPFYRFLYSFLMMAAVVTTIIITAIYLLLNPPSQGKQGWMLTPSKGVSHLAVLLALIFGLKAWDYRLKQLELVLSERGVVFGAGYTDINANYPVLMILMILAVVIALVFIANIFLRRYRLFIYGILVLTGVSLLGGWAYPSFIQSFVVEPSEFNFEREYLSRNIEFTREAYGVDQFSTRRYDPDQMLNWEDLRENPGTINNVRLWDYRPLLTTFNELQAIRLYYRFNDVDIDRYTIDGEYRQVMLAARELDKSRLAPQAQTWVNMQLQYTHGYGVTMSPVNEVTAEGLPRYFLGDIPPSGNLTVDNPAIYFGELTNDYVIVNTDTPEFHYATAGDDNVFTFYEGDAGIPVHSIFRRALFALKFGEYRIMISNELSNESRVLFDRNISDRVRKLAPFLRYDGDPYIVVSDERLFWIQDAYTVTNSYPYSAPYGSINYIRNSVKVVVDAYNGSVDYYIIDPDDPLIQTYSRIFPELFSPVEEMPEGLMAHLRYPEDLFNIQAQMLTLYHITDPNIFYTREDLWAVPTEQSFGQEQQMEPYYTILQLPGYVEPEYVLILPFTPDSRNNMISWMVARCDQPNYGEVEIFLFPADRVILGPNQIENRIDQSTEISEQFTLWGQAGSRVIRGNLLVLPISNALLYVEPIFLEAEGGGLPELARVIVVFGETVVMEDTLDRALIRIFGEMDALPPDLDFEDLPIVQPDDEDDLIPGEPVVIDDTLVSELIRQAQIVYEEAIESQQAGDWAAYGEKIKELEQILNDLARMAP
ncbi:MAG: UPF0182 family protein [Firmicutes bacterium]|nr:UPF0182 family protein [Bacillota bacterium]